MKTIRAAILLTGILVLRAVTAAGDDTTTKPHAFAVEKHGHGSPVILIPGLGCSGAVWQATVAALESKHECHVLTLAGFAGQPPISAPLIETVSKELAAYIAEQKLGKPAIIGHSLGGFTALHVAARHPDAVGPIIIVDSIPFFGGMMPGGTPESAREAGTALKSAMEQQTHEQFMDASKQALERMIASEAGQKKALEWMAASDQRTVAGAFGYLFSSDLRTELPKIKSRALVLEAGVEPGSVPEALYQQQYAGLKGVKLVRDPKARHFIMFDDPDFFMGQIKSFLDQ